ncbi:MAG: ABC transporter permease subunit [Rhodococcus sp.]|nr:ABC transporter permease subunit [Rhodococcus sp. (in: high G+C Gram-positive bacteria)]
MNFTNVRVITVLELRQRVRSSRWKFTALALFVLVSAIVFGSLYVTTASNGSYEDWSPVLLTTVLFIVLFVGLIGAPALSGASINGDRRDATLAVVQATPISGWELALGKLLGAWLASLTFIVVSLPYLIWGIATAPNSVHSSILAIVVLAVALGCYCAMGLGFSSITSRPTGSTMLTIATVFFFLLGLPAIFGLAMPSVQRSHEVLTAHEEWDWNEAAHDPDYRPVCTDRMETRNFHHTENTWWLLAPNPLLMIFDAQSVGSSRGPGGDYGIVLDGARIVSEVRSGPVIEGYPCNKMYRSYTEDDSYYERRGDQYVGHSWYWGLLATGLVGGLGFVTAARRLQVPVATMSRGMRIA